MQIAQYILQSVVDMTMHFAISSRLHNALYCQQQIARQHNAFFLSTIDSMMHFAIRSRYHNAFWYVLLVDGTYFGVVNRVYVAQCIRVDSTICFAISIRQHIVFCYRQRSRQHNLFCYQQQTAQCILLSAGDGILYFVISCRQHFVFCYQQLQTALCILLSAVDDKLLLFAVVSTIHVAIISSTRQHIVLQQKAECMSLLHKNRPLLSILFTYSGIYF